MAGDGLRTGLLNASAEVASGSAPVVGSDAAWRQQVAAAQQDGDDSARSSGDVEAGGGGQVPPVLSRYCNIKRPFGEHMQCKPGGMTRMLRTLGLRLEGRHHSGIDDTRNIARIVAALAGRGAIIGVTGGSRARPTILDLERAKEKSD